MHRLNIFKLKSVDVKSLYSWFILGLMSVVLQYKGDINIWVKFSLSLSPENLYLRISLINFNCIGIWEELKSKFPGGTHTRTP